VNVIVGSILNSGEHSTRHGAERDVGECFIE